MNVAYHFDFGQVNRFVIFVSFVCHDTLLAPGVGVFLYYLGVIIPGLVHELHCFVVPDLNLQTQLVRQLMPPFLLSQRLLVSLAGRLVGVEADWAMLGIRPRVGLAALLHGCDEAPI